MKHLDLFSGIGGFAQAGQTMAKHVQRWVRTPDAKVRTALDPVLRRIASATPPDFAALAADVKLEGLLDSNADGPPCWIVRRLAGLMDVNLPREPVLEDFLPKKAAAPAITGGRKSKEKKAKPRLKKVPRGRIGAGGAPLAGAECDQDCETCSAADCESRD